MKSTYLSDEQEKIEFVTHAAKWFAEHPEHTTYTDGSIEPDCWFAVRWGLGKDCVLIFKVQDEPILYQNCIKE